MASIYKRKDRESKKSVWRAVIRLKGYPTICKSFDRKQEAEDWSQMTERQIKRGQFNFDIHNTKHTFDDLVDRFINDGLLEHHRSSEDTLRHFDYWKERLGFYGLIHITSELLGKERQYLINLPAQKGNIETKRSPATVNRYFSSLSTALSYAKKLKWIDENPYFSLSKLKEAHGRQRVLTEEEAINLLQTCRVSKHPYIYCIVLIAITSRARKGEILSLKWSDINFKNKVAFIRQTKNNRPRTIPLVEEVIMELNDIFKNRNPKKELVFASKTAFGKIDIKKVWAN